MRIQKIILSVLVVIMATALNSYSQETEYKDYTDIGVVEGPVVPIEDIFQDRNKYHRDIIVIEGKLSKLEYKSLIGGKKFTLFIVKNDQGNKIKVYARGTVEGLEEDSDIRVYGRYSKSKKFGFNKFKNVMKAKKIQIDNV